MSRVAIVVILVLILLLFFGIVHTRYKRHEYPGLKFYALNRYDNQHGLARKMVWLDDVIIRYLTRLKRKYDINHDEDLKMPFARESIVRRILRNYNSERIYEAIPTGQNGTSYTVRKGEQLHLCMRKKGTGQFEDKNSVLFVTIHELAHMGNIYWGHDDDFWAIFKFLITEAVEMGIYTPIDYSVSPIKYCGLDVTYNPYYDDTLEPKI